MTERAVLHRLPAVLGLALAIVAGLLTACTAFQPLQCTLTAWQPLYDQVSNTIAAGTSLNCSGGGPSTFSVESDLDQVIPTSTSPTKVDSASAQFVNVAGGTVLPEILAVGLCTNEGSGTYETVGSTQAASNSPATSPSYDTSQNCGAVENSVSNPGTGPPWTYVNPAVGRPELVSPASNAPFLETPDPAMLTVIDPHTHVATYYAYAAGFTDGIHVYASHGLGGEPTPNVPETLGNIYSPSQSGWTDDGRAFPPGPTKNPSSFAPWTEAYQLGARYGVTNLFDFTQWGPVDDVNQPWSPTVAQATDGAFVMYYPMVPYLADAENECKEIINQVFGETLLPNGTTCGGEFRCIGEATSTTPLGPFRDVSSDPIYCHFATVHYGRQYLGEVQNWDQLYLPGCPGSTWTSDCVQAQITSNIDIQWNGGALSGASSFTLVGDLDPSQSVGPSADSRYNDSYLAFKSDCCIPFAAGVPPTTIWMAPIDTASGDVPSPGTNAAELYGLPNLEPSEFTIENPQLWFDGTKWWLFISAGYFKTPGEYHEEVVPCGNGVTPVCSAVQPTLIMSSAQNSAVQSPGAASVFEDAEGNWWLGYAAIDAGCTATVDEDVQPYYSTPQCLRTLRIDHLVTTSGGPCLGSMDPVTFALTCGSPSSSAQPLYKPPLVSSISSQSGPVTGGGTLTINGSHLLGTYAVELVVAGVTDLAGAPVAFKTVMNTGPNDRELQVVNDNQVVMQIPSTALQAHWGEYFTGSVYVLPLAEGGLAAESSVDQYDYFPVVKNVVATGPGTAKVYGYGFMDFQTASEGCHAATTNCYAPIASVDFGTAKETVVDAYTGPGGGVQAGLPLDDIITPVPAGQGIVDVEVETPFGASQPNCQDDWYYGEGLGQSSSLVYHPLATPIRVVDTRAGSGYACAGDNPVFGSYTLVSQQALATAVPPAALALVMSVTAVPQTPANPGYLTALPSQLVSSEPGSAPSTSTVNYASEGPVSNTTTLGIGSPQGVAIYNGNATSSSALYPVDIVIDIYGYFSTGNAGSYFVAVPPTRICDTRLGAGVVPNQCNGSGLASGALGAGGMLALTVPAEGVTSITSAVLNITAVPISGSGYLVAYANGSTRPSTSNVNAAAPNAVAAMAITAISATNHEIDIYANGTPNLRVDVIVDLDGLFTTSRFVQFHTTQRFVPLQPERLCDTRTGVGCQQGPIPGGTSFAIATGSSAAPASGISGEIAGPNSINAVACTIDENCWAVDGAGNAYNGTGPGATYTFGAAEKIDANALDSVSCASTSFCMAVDAAGSSLSESNGSWSAAFDIDASTALKSVSCASTTFCVAVDAAGNALTWSGSAWSRSKIDGLTALGSVSCPTPAFCIAVDAGGNALTWSGSAWSAARIDASTALKSVSCASTTFCVAVDAAGNALTWSGSAWSRSKIDGSTALSSVSCPTNVECFAVDLTGNLIVMRGATWSPPSAIDVVPGPTALTSVDCSSALFCVAGDARGVVVGNLASGWTFPRNVDRYGGITSVSCDDFTPLPLSCITGDSHGTVGSDYQDIWSPPTTADSGNTVTGVACGKYPNICVAVDSRGDVMTNSGGLGWTQPTHLDAYPFDAVTCFPFAFLYYGEVQCVAVDAQGNAFALRNSGGWTGPSAVDPGNDLSAVTCLQGICVAADLSGNVVTINPQGLNVIATARVDTRPLTNRAADYWTFSVVDARPRCS